MLGKRPAAHDRRSISRRVITHLLLCTIVLLGLVFTSASAEAQWHKRRQALALAGEAIDLYKAGDYQPALEKFTKANELLPAPTLKISSPDASIASTDSKKQPKFANSSGPNSSVGPPESTSKLAKTP